MIETEHVSRRESSLHLSIKRQYFLQGDKFEAKVDDFIIDIVRGDLLIEIQTVNFSAIKHKLEYLLRNHKVCLVYPIPKKKWIVHKAISNGKVINTRRSPKEGSPIDIFEELVRIPSLFCEENLSLEVLMIEEEEIRCQDGKGSWRRKGVSIKDRKLIGVFEKIRFESKVDFLRFIPANLLQASFSNKSLAENLKMPIRQAQKMTYSLRKMGVLEEAGKKRNQLLFSVQRPN